MLEEYHEMMSVDMKRVCFFDEEEDDIVLLLLLLPRRDRDPLRERERNEINQVLTWSMERQGQKPLVFVFLFVATLNYFY